MDTNLLHLAAQLLGTAAINVALIGYLRSDTAAAELRSATALAASEARTTAALIESEARSIAATEKLAEKLDRFEQEVRGWREDIHKETKDFHARLYALEKKKLEE